jgi:hypothetical protein
MYLRNSGGGYRNGQQVALRGPFLVMLQPDTGDTSADCAAPIRCVVRKVALSQLGHFMVGRANIGGRWISVSGSYGHDGLPLPVPPAVYLRGVILPDNLRDAWDKGGGWNGAGAEAEAIRSWALANLENLTR